MATLAKSAVATLFLAACGGAAPEPALAPAPSQPAAAAPAEAPAPPAKEPVATGKDCATATAECGGGVCAVALKNGCDQAITCDLFISSTCKAKETMIEAAGRKRDTFAAKSDGEFSVKAPCMEGEVIATSVKSLNCK